jgi:AraC-like DNA-binding protein
MGEETSQRGLPTTTGFAAREALAMLRKHNIATAPLLLRAGLSEHGLARAADEGNGLPQRVSAIGQCKFLEYAAEAMNGSAFGLHLAGQIDWRDVGLYFYASSTAPGVSLGQIAWLLGYEGSTSFNHAFKRWTGRSPSADRNR